MSNLCDQVLAFMHNWETYDLDTVMSYMADDATFTPDLISPPVKGRDEIEKLWSYYMRMMQAYRMEPVNIAQTSQTVLFERIEYVTTPKQVQVTLPIIGVYEFNSEGKIKAWRDYVESTALPS